jgi:hypothetical protein
MHGPLVGRARGWSLRANPKLGLAGAVTGLQPRRLAYVTTRDASDVHACSGTISAIVDCLIRAAFELESIGLHEREPLRLLTRVAKPAFRASGSELLRDFEPIVAKGYAAQAERRLRFVDHDIVFSLGIIPIARLAPSKPIVLWADATFDRASGAHTLSEPTQPGVSTSAPLSSQR